MEQFEYKILLPTSGTGSRLGEITRHTNKALISVGGVPAITRILALYPADVPVVVTLGHLGEQVKNYLIREHSDRVFEFVVVDTYAGPGSSLGYSMLRARSRLQCPFIFHACDGICSEPIPVPRENWMGGCVVGGREVTKFPFREYCTQAVEGDTVIRLNRRGDQGYAIHVGIDGIRDFDAFWATLERIYDADPFDTQISDVSVLSSMLENGTSFAWVPLSTWQDTGNREALQRAETAVLRAKKYENR